MFYDPAHKSAGRCDVAVGLSNVAAAADVATSSVPRVHMSCIYAPNARWSVPLLQTF